MKKIYLSIIAIALLFIIKAANGQTVPNWTKTDTKGNEYILHDILSEGNAVILDFFATWCGPCAQSTPALESIWEDYDKGEKKLYIFGMDVDNSESNAQIDAFKSNYGATYPAFKQCATQYNYYNNLYGNGGIPLFVLIIPNIEDPLNSEVVWNQEGWAPAVESSLRNKIISEGYDTGFATGIIEIDEITQISLFPNPAISSTSIFINQINSADISIELYDNLGQKISHVFQGELSGGATTNIDLDISPFSNGLYYLKIQSQGSSKSIKLNIIH